MQFNQRLKEVRVTRGLSQQAVAETLGLFRQQYARYETGTQQMQIEHYKRLAKFYRVSIDYLSGMDEETDALDVG